MKATHREICERLGKSKEWLRGHTLVAKEIKSRYRELSVNSINAYEKYTSELIYYIDKAWQEGRFKAKDIIPIFNTPKNHASGLAHAHCFLNRTIFKVREPYTFFYMSTMRKLEKIKEIVLSQKI